MTIPIAFVNFSNPIAESRKLGSYLFRFGKCSLLLLLLDVSSFLVLNACQDSIAASRCYTLTIILHEQANISTLHTISVTSDGPVPTDDDVVIQLELSNVEVNVQMPPTVIRNK